MKLLSVVMTGRDDDYEPDFKYRLSTTVNFLAQKLKGMGELQAIEVLVTDWGSSVPLAESLSLSPEAEQICRFVTVSPSVIRQIQGGREDYNTSLAANVAIRRTQGEFIMLQAADMLMPQHAMEALLRLLSGKTPFPSDIRKTYLMCRRGTAPWEFVKTQPNLQAWDRYLLLNVSVLPRWEDWYNFSAGDGAGSLIAHRSLWHQVRGLNERMAGWGGGDQDIAMRITQAYPWIELTGMGVMFVKMEHSPLGRRGDLKKVEESPEVSLSVSATPQVNGPDWGLKDHDLPIQAPKNVSGQAGSIPQASTRSLKGMTHRQLLAELTDPALRQHLHSIIQHFFLQGWSIRSEDIPALFLLSWYARTHYPQKYLEFGVKAACTLAAVASARQDIEIYGIERWEGVERSFGPGHIVAMLDESWVGYTGHARYLNGEIQTAFERLEKSFIGPFSLDLIFVRADLLGKAAAAQVLQLLPKLGTGGALVLTDDSSDQFNLIWKGAQSNFPRHTFFRFQNWNAGLVLAVGPAKEAVQGGPELLLSTDWIGRLYLKCQFRRVIRGLKKPAAYPQNASRVIHRIKSRFSFRK